MRSGSSPLRCPCEGKHFSAVFTYTAPPPGEVRFEFAAGRAYRREVRRCGVCGHFVSVYDGDAGTLYTQGYVDSTYGENGIRRAFERLVGLDPAKSDNVGRVRRILEFAAGHFGSAAMEDRAPSVLDVGSGLCVFLHRMKVAGWDCTAVDPDIRAVTHARETVGVTAICGDFTAVEGLGAFDVVTFNKVLEHLEDPVGMLAKGARHVRARGFVYVEVPDGERAAADGPEREEFFIDHLHVFSCASLACLAVRAGFSVVSMERLREPSGKYTLRAFVVPVGAGRRVSSANIGESR